MTASDVVSLVGVVITAVIGPLIVRQVTKVHREIQTSNGHTAGRILEDILTRLERMEDEQQSQLKDIAGVANEMVAHLLNVEPLEQWVRAKMKAEERRRL